MLAFWANLSMLLLFVWSRSITLLFVIYLHEMNGLNSVFSFHFLEILTSWCFFICLTSYTYMFDISLKFQSLVMHWARHPMKLLLPLPTKTRHSTKFIYWNEIFFNIFVLFLESVIFLIFRIVKLFPLPGRCFHIKHISRPSMESSSFYLKKKLYIKKSVYIGMQVFA